MLEHATTNRVNVPKVTLRVIFLSLCISENEQNQTSFLGGPHVSVGLLLMMLLLEKACHLLTTTFRCFPVSASAYCFAVAILTAAMHPHFVAPAQVKNTPHHCGAVVD